MSTISFQERQNKIDQLEQKIQILDGTLRTADDARIDEKKKNNDRLFDALKQLDVKLDQKILETADDARDDNNDRLFETLKRLEVKVSEQDNLLLNIDTSIINSVSSEQKNKEFLNNMKLIIDQIQKNQIQQSQNNHDLNKFKEEFKQELQKQTEKHTDDVKQQKEIIQQSQNIYQKLLSEAINKIKQEIQQEFIQQQAKQFQKHTKEHNDQGEKIIRQMNEMKTDFETHLHKSFDQREQQGSKLIELTNQFQQLTQQLQPDSEKMFGHIDETKIDICKHFDQKLNQVNTQIQKHNQEIQEQTELLYELSNQIQEQTLRAGPEGSNASEQIGQIASQIVDMKNEFFKLDQNIKQQQIASDERNDKLDDLLDKVEDRNDKLVDLLDKVDERNDKIDDLLDTVTVK